MRLVIFLMIFVTTTAKADTNCDNLKFVGETVIATMLPLAENLEQQGLKAIAARTMGDYDPEMEKFLSSISGENMKAISAIADMFEQIGPKLACVP